MNVSTLTPRQEQVIAGYASGQTQAEIAADLGVSVDRVKTLSAEARDHLGARTTAQAVAIAVALGLVPVHHGQAARLRHARELLGQALRAMGDFR